MSQFLEKRRSDGLVEGLTRSNHDSTPDELAAGCRERSQKTASERNDRTDHNRDSTTVLVTDPGGQGRSDDLG
jgi:hypothetical protein